MNRQKELKSAIEEFLSQAEMHPMSDAWELAQTGDYVMVFRHDSFSYAR